MTPRPPNRRLEGVPDLRVMAHPLRVRLYYALQALEAATASRLAQSVNESPALISYHLRQLRDHGFVEEAPDLVSDRRERWWRPTTDGFRFSLPESTDVPEARAAAVALQRTALANQLERLESWRDEQPSWGPAWSEASISSDVMLKLSSEELAALGNEIQAVISSWRQRALTTHDKTNSSAGMDKRREGDSPPDGPTVDHDGRRGMREHIFFFMHAFPFRP